MQDIYYYGACASTSVIRYIYKGRIYNETIKIMWNRLEDEFTVPNGIFEYKGLKHSVRVFDSKTECFVRCKYIYRAKYLESAVKLEFVDGKEIVVSAEQYVPTKRKSLSRFPLVLAQDWLKKGKDYICVGVNYDVTSYFDSDINEEYRICDLYENKVKRATVVNNMRGYQLVTDTGYYDCSGILLSDGNMKHKI